MENTRKKPQKSPFPHPHLGEMVRKFLEENRISQAELARKMSIGQSTVASHLRQESFHFKVLWHICTALQHDFLEELQKQFPPIMPPKSNTHEQERIKELEKELAIYKKMLKIEE